jgi:hypothetical protein
MVDVYLTIHRFWDAISHQMNWCAYEARESVGKVALRKVDFEAENSDVRDLLASKRSLDCNFSNKPICLGSAGTTEVTHTSSTLIINVHAAC